MNMRSWKQMAACLAAGCLLVAAGPANASPKDFELPDLEGNKHRLSDYRGKWVVVNYWATWCPPCLEEIPELEDFHSRHKDTDAVVIGVNMEDVDVDYLRDFVDSLMVSYPMLRDRVRPFTELGQITGLPTSYIISPEGKVVAYQVGPVEARHLDDFLARKTAGANKGAAAD